MALDKRSQVSLTFGTYKSHCLIRLNISLKYYDFGLNSYRKNIFQDFPHKNALGIKELRALRGFFGPPMRLKYKNCFSPICSFKFIRTIAIVYKSQITLTFTLAMVTKMATKIS